MMQRNRLMIRPPSGSLRIKHKVFMLISLIMAICFLVTYISQQYAYSIYDEQLYAKSSQLLNLSSSGIENELRKIESISFSVVADPQIQTWLRQLVSEPAEFEKYRIQAFIIERLVQYSGYEKYIDSIDVIDPSGNEYRAGLAGKTEPEQKAYMLEEAKQGQGEIRWLYPNEKNNSLVAARQIRSFENLELQQLGTLVIRIRLQQIVDDIAAGTELKRGEMRIESGDRVLYPAGEERRPIGDHMEAYKRGYSILTMDGKTYFATQVRSAYLNWTYSSLIPYEAIFQKIVWMKRLLLFGFFGSLIAVLVLAYRFSRGITKPIEDLIARMKLAQKGDFRLAQATDDEMAPLPMDEIGQLHRTFRMMIRQINELITENYAKQLTIKETQYQALQAQINPHFLYNTLESINWLAKMNGERQISSMVEALGFLLRSSISLKEPLISLGEELEIVGHYLTIQQYRFEDRLVVQMEAPDELKPYLVPKFIVQPLVENAIHYALEQMIDPCVIRISVREGTDTLTIAVEDNGPGMDAQQLEQVREGKAETRRSGIGLRNIQERIVIAFGQAYGLRIDSEKSAGTKVTAVIPKETRGTYVQSAAGGR